MSKLQQAKDLVEQAQQLGHRATVEGNWVVWRPPLPAALLMEMAQLSDQITKVVLNGTTD